MGKIYVATLGNDPIPALLGLRLVQKQGPVEDVVFMAEPPGEGYEKKREALFSRLQAEGVPFTVKDLTEGFPRDFLELSPHAWVNLTGGSKLWAVRLLDMFQAAGAQIFIVDAHRRLDPPRAVFLEDPPRVECLDEGILTLDDYLELHIKPMEIEYEWSVAPPNFPPGIPAINLRMEDPNPTFLVYKGQPYLVVPTTEEGGLSRAKMAMHAARAKKLGGELCLAILHIPKRYLRHQPMPERETILERWKHQAQETGVKLAYAKERVEQIFSSKRDTGSASLSIPTEGPVLFTVLSEQTVPLYASLITYEPKTLYLLVTPEMKDKVSRIDELKKELPFLNTVHKGWLASPWDIQGIISLVKPVVESAYSQGLMVQANLNGGTSALVLGLYLTIRNLGNAHYLKGDYIVEGSEEKRIPPWEKGHPEHLLMLRGYRFEEEARLGRPSPDKKLIRLAKDLIKDWEQLQRIWSVATPVKRFFEAWEHACNSQIDKNSKKGLPLEYFVWATLKKYMKPLGGKVLFSGKLADRSWPSGHAQKDHLASEIDSLVYYRGQLIPVECKMRSDALLQQAAYMEQLAYRLGGIQGRGLMIAGWWGENPPRSSSRLTYMAIHGHDPLPEGVYRFPDDLPKIFPSYS